MYKLITATPGLALVLAVTHLLTPLPRLSVLGQGDGGRQLPSIMLENQVRSLPYCTVNELEPFRSLKKLLYFQVQKPQYLKVFVLLPILHLKEMAPACFS